MPSISEIVNNHKPDLGAYEELYKWFHAHPELSFCEKETAAAIAKHLATFNAFDIHAHIGGHGLAAVLKNGTGKTVLLRADIDALPVQEQTGLEYASTKRMQDVEGVEKPVMHACGHDMHITALLAAAETLVRARDAWSGTLLLVFQPAEEKGKGAQAMIDDGLYEKIPIPDVVIGAHVMPEKAGVIGTKQGLIASSADSYLLNINGRQTHASTPHRGIDPIVQAASTILRLQTIVARETDPLDFAVVTVSAMHAGDAENIIPGTAELKLDIRAARPATRSRLLDSVRSIVDAEALASRNPHSPQMTQIRQFPLLFNDATVTAAIESAFHAHFNGVAKEVGVVYTPDIARLQGSEDFGVLATAVGRPSCFFLYGGTEERLYERLEGEGRMDEVPGNHSPFFAPAVRPTLRVGVEGYAVSAFAFLGKVDV
ncbi:hypothetical protein M3J09_003526 [Ascochyta lentis]